MTNKQTLLRLEAIAGIAVPSVADKALVLRAVSQNIYAAFFYARTASMQWVEPSVLQIESAKLDELGVWHRLQYLLRILAREPATLVQALSRIRPWLTGRMLYDVVKALLLQPPEIAWDLRALVADFVGQKNPDRFASFGAKWRLIMRPIFLRFAIDAGKDEIKEGNLIRLGAWLDLCDWIACHENRRDASRKDVREDSAESPDWEQARKTAVDFLGLCLTANAKVSLDWRNVLASIIATLNTGYDMWLDRGESDRASKLRSMAGRRMFRRRMATKKPNRHSRCDWQINEDVDACYFKSRKNAGFAH